MTCFILYAYVPGASGISDVISRLLELDPESEIWCHRTSASPTQQVRVVDDLTGFTNLLKAKTAIHVVCPWDNQSFSEWEDEIFKKVADLQLPRMLWLHELWYISIAGVSLSWKQKLKRFFQIRRFRYVFRKLRPTVVSTTNRFYQSVLGKIGIESVILPNNGMIPIGTLAAGREFVNLQIELRETAWLAISFGNLALTDWDWRDALRDFVEEADRRGKRPVWVILGRNLQEPVGRIRRFLNDAGASVEIIYAGEQSATKVDHWIWGADFALSGHPYAVWQKSSGLLSMTERNLPVVTPRKGFEEDQFATANPLLVSSFRELPVRSSTFQSLVPAPSDVLAILAKLFEGAASCQSCRLDVQ